MKSQAAECLMILKDYKTPAKIFEECNLILKALDCYECISDWEGLLLCLKRNKSKFKESERDALINKYVPIALNSIFRTMSSEDHIDENKGKELQEKYLGKVGTPIQEESDYASEEQSEEEGEEQKEDLPQEETKSEMNKEPLQEEVPEEEVKVEDDEEEVIDTITKNMINESSFSVISKAELQDNFEHLSNFDPEDEFLSNDKSFTIVGSVVTNDEDTLSEYSDFSILTNSRVNSFTKGNKIETNRDIYVEDIIMQKIIYYVSLFSDEAKEYMLKLRSNSQLFQNKSEDMKLDEFELELDNIDTELVKILLDVLENFDMFRLCMIVCNRYHVTEHLTRYLTSVCYKYSNLKLIDYKGILNINNSDFRKRQQQVSILANEAFHNMLSLVSPNLIEQVKTEDVSQEVVHEKQRCWRMLFFLGFWKKLIYILDSMASLQLCYSIKQFRDFKIIYLLYYREQLSDEVVRELIEDKTGKWIDPDLDKESPLGVLCYKIKLEEIVEDLLTPDNETDFSLNIKLNSWMRLLETVDLINLNKLDNKEVILSLLDEFLTLGHNKLFKVTYSRDS